MYEYLMVISPNRYTSEMFYFESRHLKATQNLNCDYTTVPHTTMIDWLSNKESIPVLQKTFRETISKCKYFKVKLNGFNFFENPGNKNVLFIDIDNSRDIQDVVSRLKRDVFLKASVIDNMKFSLTPHMTLAKRVSLYDLNRAKPFYNFRNFNASFNLDYITLLRREINQKQRWISNFSIVDKYYLASQ